MRPSGDEAVRCDASWLVGGVRVRIASRVDLRSAAYADNRAAMLEALSEIDALTDWRRGVTSCARKAGG